MTSTRGRRKTLPALEIILGERERLRVLTLQMLKQTFAPGAFRLIITGRFDQPTQIDRDVRGIIVVLQKKEG